MAWASMISSSFSSTSPQVPGKLSQSKLLHACTALGFTMGDIAGKGLSHSTSCVSMLSGLTICFIFLSLLRAHQVETQQAGICKEVGPFRVIFFGTSFNCLHRSSTFGQEVHTFVSLQGARQHGPESKLQLQRQGLDTGPTSPVHGRRASGISQTT